MREPASRHAQTRRCPWTLCRKTWASTRAVPERSCPPTPLSLFAPSPPAPRLPQRACTYVRVRKLTKAHVKAYTLPTAQKCSQPSDPGTCGTEWLCLFAATNIIPAHPSVATSNDLPIELEIGHSHPYMPDACPFSYPAHPNLTPPSRLNRPRQPIPRLIAIPCTKGR